MLKHKKRDNVILLQEGDSLSWKIAKRYNKVYVHAGSFQDAERVADDTLDQIDYYFSSYQAGCEINWVYDQYIKENEIEILNEILGDKRAHLAVKKNILQALGRIFYSFILARKFVKRYGIKEQIDFIPVAFPYSIYRIISQKNDLFLGNVKIPKDYIKAMKYQEAEKNIVYRAKLILYPLWVSLCMGLSKHVPKSIKKYHYGIHIWDSWISSVSTARMDFLEGQDSVNQKNTLYIIDGYVSKSNLLKAKASGYDCCSFKEMIHNYPAWKYIKENILSHLKLSAKCFFACMRNSKSLLIESCLRAIQGYVFWEVFYTEYSIDIFITTQEPGNINRVLIQKRYGAKCLFIFWSTSYDFVYRQDMNTHFDSYYSHMIYDVMISSRMSNEYFKKNNNFIEKYFEIGVLRSDIIFQTKHDTKLKSALKEKLGVPLDKKIIGFFDTSVGTNGIFTNREGFQMLDDMYRFLESDNNYFMIFRSRGNCHLSENADIRNACNRIAQHKRAIYINNLAVLYYAFEVMGVCDLVVGGFAESAPLESVSGGIRTLCYFSAKFDRDVFALNNFPRFCVHNFDELKKNADYWLYQCSQKDFCNFQNTYINKYVDSYCDGKAVKRLHSILMAS